MNSFNGDPMSTPSVLSRVEETFKRLAKHGQEHLLTGIESLGESELLVFIDELDHIDLDEMDRLISEVGVQSNENSEPAQAPEPAPYIERNSPEALSYRDAGEDLIRQHKVAAFTVAGGQGTRLGWTGPKGTFPATPIVEKSLFRVFAEQIISQEQRYETEIPWYVMTSPLNDSDTKSFFVENNWFGKSPDSIMLFPQGVMPAVNAEGKMLLESPGKLALSPDGHGGSLRALRRSGALADMQRRGVEAISYFQVDNPTVHAIDPTFLGVHVASQNSSAEMSSKMVAKKSADEKVGVFCHRGGRTLVIEYSDLDTTLAQAVRPDGRLRFLSGSIALHILGVDFVDRLTGPESSTKLPFHQAHKKVPFWDPTTQTHVNPQEPNGIKFEMFVFDALFFAQESLVLETDRVEEFAPIKNADGDDSANTSKALQIERAARWIEAAGGSIPRTPDGTVDAIIEIEPSTALEAQHLENQELPEITPGQSIVF